jgi:hypothetical protein
MGTTALKEPALSGKGAYAALQTTKGFPQDVAQDPPDQIGQEDFAEHWRLHLTMFKQDPRAFRTCMAEQAEHLKSDRAGTSTKPIGHKGKAFMDRWQRMTGGKYKKVRPDSTGCKLGPPTLKPLSR